MRITKTVEVETCHRCLSTWEPRVEKPKNCAKCRSPYWFKPRREINVKNRDKYGFERIQLKKWVSFPFFKLPNGELDAEANGRRARALDQYMTRHGLEYSWEATMGKGLMVYRRS